MATARDPDDLLRSNADKENFQRLTRLLITGGTTLLREIFDMFCSPNDLPKLLQDSTTKNKLKAAKLSKPLWDCLYPSPGVYGKSQDFDVTLLFRLLRTLFTLIPPATGWDELPASGDHSLEADLARIKYYRNSIYGHASQNMEMSDAEFSSLWNEISEALVRIAGHISPEKKTEWQKAINKFFTDSLTEEDRRNVEELLTWYRNDMEVKKSIEKLETTTQEMKDQMDQLGKLQQRMDRKLSVLTESSREQGARLALRIDYSIPDPQVRTSERAATSQEEGTRATVTRSASFTTQAGASEIAATSEEEGAGASVTWSPSPITQAGAAKIVATSQEEGTRASVARSPSPTTLAGASEIAASSHEEGTRASAAGNSSPTTQDVLNLAAMKYLNTINPSTPEELNGFVQYLKEVRQVLIVDTKRGSLIIIVECTSLEILDGLWNDYCSGQLNKMAQKYLVTEELLKDLGLLDVKLTVTILEDEYKRCREHFLQQSESKDTRPHEKVQETTEESTSTSDKDRQQNKQFRVIPERETWHQVPPHGRHFKHKAAGAKTEQSRGRGEKTTRGTPGVRPSAGGTRYSQKKVNEGAVRGRHDDGRGKRGDQGRGRGRGRGQGRGFDKTRGGPQQRGGGHGHQSGAEPRQQFDAASQGFKQPNIKYEWNKLYVLGLHYKTTPDAVKNYIERISGYNVKYVEWFKPNGKAIVTLDTFKIKGFADILKAAKERPLERVQVLIERAPECRSIFANGFPEKTTKDEVLKFFHEWGEIEDVSFSDPWDENVKEKRVIVYFKHKKSVLQSIKDDHFFDDKPLHVEAFYPFMGTLTPVDEPSKSTRPTSGEVEGDRQPHFYKPVDKDIMEFLMKSNQESRLRERLHSNERAGLGWKNGEEYALIKYDGTGKKLDREFEEKAWKSRCSEIVDSFISSCTTKEFSVDEEIWEAVADQLPQLEGFLPKFTAHVKLLKNSHAVKLICQKSNMSDFGEKLEDRLMVIRQQEDEKKLERRTLTDIATEKLLLFQNARIEDVLKKEFLQNIQVKINLSNKNLEIKTPKGYMASVVSYLRKRQDEMDQNAIAVPPEILKILKTKVGRRKMTEELPEGCAFNVDDRSEQVILLGRTLPETQQGRVKAKEVLISNREVRLSARDNGLISSTKWEELCKKLVKRLTIRHKRELACIAVFGFKKDVTEAVTRMRDFLNEKKATEGETRLTTQIHRKFFNDYYKDELKRISDELCHFGVQIVVDESGERIKYSGNVEGVKEAEERIYILLENIKERSFPISLPGMQTFLTQEEGVRLIETVEVENKCIIRITDEAAAQEDDDADSDDDEPLRDDEENEEEFDGVETFSTTEGKKVTWKIGNITEEQADVLVCSVGSKFNLAIGAIANAMSKAAGPELQEQLKEKTSGKQFGEGDIVHTGPGNLHCRHVIHCVCCPWKGNLKEEQLLQELFRKCFDKASELGACSISLPLVGTGNLGFPYDTAVQIMIQAAVDYSHSNPDSPLEEVKFVVFGGDEKGIETIMETFREFKGEQRPRLKTRKPEVRKNKPTPVLAEFYSKEVCVEDMMLKVLKGDITKERSDAICNIVTKDLNMKFGNLSRAIIQACGSTVENELKSKAPQHPAGSVVITSAGRLSAKHIVHMVVGPVTKKNLQTCVEKALEEVDSMDLKSVSIPAVGSGGLGQTADESAELVFGAIRAFMAKLECSIQEIRVVVFDDSVTAAFVTELEAIQREYVDLPHSDDEDDDQGYYEMGSEASINVLTRRRPQKIVIHARSESFEAIMTALKDGVEKACGNPRVIRHEIISRFPKRCMRELKRMSRARDVRLEQPEPNVLTLEGLPKDVMDVNSEVSDVIQEQMEREHKEERAEQMSKTVQWYLVNPGGIFAAFDKMANNEIESAYKEKKPSLLFTHQDLKAEINFENKEVTFLRTGAIKTALRKDVLPLPDEWDPQPRDNQGKEEILYMVSLPEDSQEYKAVEEKFLRTLGGKVIISKIERIQNPSMFNSYMLRKQSMDEKNGTIDNELELFHGTKPESVKEINVQGFNRSLCGVHGAAYGDGVYFAKDAYYSLSYSQPGPNDERCMYLARVLVGKYTAGKQRLKKPPPKDPSAPEILFDSVVNKEEDPTIFVVFNDYHVYPKYLITFEKTKK